MATGLTAASNYLLAFVATKTYFNLETSLSMPGVTSFYCFIAFIGYVFPAFIHGRIISSWYRPTKNRWQLKKNNSNSHFQSCRYVQNPTRNRRSNTGRN